MKENLTEREKYTVEIAKAIVEATNSEWGSAPVFRDYKKDWQLEILEKANTITEKLGKQIGKRISLVEIDDGFNPAKAKYDVDC